MGELISRKESRGNHGESEGRSLVMEFDQSLDRITPSGPAVLLKEGKNPVLGKLMVDGNSKNVQKLEFLSTGFGQA